MNNDVFFFGNDDVCAYFIRISIYDKSHQRNNKMMVGCH